MPRCDTAGHLECRRVVVGARPITYWTAGHGLPAVFLHGWALTPNAYRRSLERLVRLGCRVLAPALPEFGHTGGLAAASRDLPGYSAWVAAFLDAAGVAEPALVVGHSFGGGVAARFAHDHPDRTAHLVLVNSIGSGICTRTATTAKLMADRSLWDWAVAFTKDIATSPRLVATVRAIGGDAVPNILSNPLGVWRVAGLARHSDLAAEMTAIRRLGVPVSVVTSEGDLVIPRGAFDDLCDRLSVRGVVVPGRHSWLLTEPEAFAEAVLWAVTTAQAEQAARAGLLAGLRPVASF